MIIFIFIAVIVSIFYQNIISLGFSLGSLSLGLFPIVFGSFYWNLNRKAVFLTLISCLITVLILFITKQLTPETAIITLPISILVLLTSHIFIYYYRKKL